MDAVVDRFVVSRKHEKAIKAGIAAHAAGRRRADAGPRRQGREQGGGGAVLSAACAAPTHHFVYGDIEPEFFMFNNPESACRTCGGLGVDKLTHPELLVPDPKRSIRGGCFVREAFKYNPDTWDGRMMYSLAKALGLLARHAVEGAARDGAPRDPLRHRAEEDRAAARRRRRRSSATTGRASEVGFGGIARRIERYYRRYRQRGEASSRMEAWLDKVMVEHTCPDCNGARLRATRLLFTVAGRTIHDVGQLNFDELHAFLGTVKPTGRGADAGRQVLKEIRGRLELLLGIGLDYLNFNRRSGTLSGGESQRIRLSTQIGSGLMGMLYVLDEPSIGLHPKDNVKMIATLESLRDIGNTVIVVEHDEDTIRAADHLVEMGPGPGVHGGTVVVQGTIDDMLACKASPTGQFLSGKRVDRDADAAAEGQRQDADRARRAREQPQVDRRHVSARHAGRDHRRVRIGQEHAGQRDPLQGAVEAAGRHAHAAGRARRASTGIEHVHKVVNIDQSPIGRNSRSNPATYIGFYDTIRDLFTQAPLSVERGYKAGPVQLQRQGRPLRGVPGRGRRSPRSSTSCPTSR